MTHETKTIQTTNENPDFIKLVKELDTYLWNRYPELQSNYWGNNIIELNPNVILIYKKDEPVACGCFKKYDTNTIEIKRMFVSPKARGMGFALSIISELEKLALQQGFSWAVLETLYKQNAAISLYQKAGYSIVENYGSYAGLKESICMKKEI